MESTGIKDNYSVSVYYLFRFLLSNILNVHEYILLENQKNKIIIAK